MILLELNTTANQYISLNGEALAHYWKALIESMGSPQYRMDTDHGGFVDLTFGTLTLSLDVFSSNWPPPRQLALTAKYTALNEVYSSLLASGVATSFRASGVDGTAFIDQDNAGTGAILAANLDKYIELTDANGKKAGGWIKAQGTGETLGADLFDPTIGTFEGGGAGTTGSWVAYGNNTIEAEDQGAGDFALKIAYVDNANGAYLYFSDAYDLSANLTVKALYKFTFSEKATGSVLIQGQDGVNYLDWGTYTNAVFANITKYFTSHHATACRMRLAGLGAGEVLWLDNLVLKQITAPTANGATIVSTQGGTTYNWASVDAGFDWNDLATYEIFEGTILFEGDLYLTSFDETTASYEMKAIKYTTRLLTEGVDYNGNTVPYPKAFGTVTHVNPLRVADNDSKPTYHLGGLGTAADAKTIVNFDTSDAGAKTKVTVDAAHGWANDTSITIAGTVNFDGTHTISSVSGATFVIDVAFPTDASETLPIHASAFVAGTFAVFDDGVPIQENVQVNVDGTFSLDKSPVGEVTISGTADDTDLAEIMTWGQGQLGVTSIDTTASRATAPDVNYWATSQMPLIDFLSELCAFFTHYFYIKDDTLYLGDLLLDNGTSTLTEYEYFKASYSAYVPVNQIKATWTTREAYNGFVDEVRQARYVKDIKNMVVESVSTVSSGTTDSTDAGYLADSGATFATDGVKVGDIAQNTTDNTSTVVTAVTETKLTVRDDIFTDAEDYIVGPGFPYGQEISVEPFHDAKSNVQTALQNILTVLNKDTANVTIPMSASLPVPGEKVTFPDTQTLSALSTYIRVRALTYDFGNEEVMLTGEGVIS